MPNPDTAWVDAATETVASYRKMIDAVLAQLTDSELHIRPTPEFNSVAVILRHLGGNLHSRWTDFLTTDGEKPSRDRDTEFMDWEGDRESLVAYFDRGWNALATALSQIDDSNVHEPIFIRGEKHSIPQALSRSLTHLTYHVGQMTIIARMVHDGTWKWLTIAPGKSDQHNHQTWGTSASRSVFGNDPEGS